MTISTFDTTLRDGTQGESVSFSMEDKIVIASRLDHLGIDYIEGGWPGSNPKDRAFFLEAKRHRFRHSKLTAFGSTRLARNAVEVDANVANLLDAETPVVSIFGKTWDFHVHSALGITEEENLRLIYDTVAYLKAHGREVVYDAEHFFDGFRANRDFALRTLDAARRAGADVLCLCDTNGGSLPHSVGEIVAEVRERFGGVVGIHAHNDCELAVANTLAAVQAGAAHVQGTVNGYGERCGNANLVSVLANLELKLGHSTIGSEKLKELTATAHFVSELANLPLRSDQAYVGPSAFAHKGGIHVSAVLKNAATYEHVQPELVGNRQRVLLSDLSGRSNVNYKLDQMDLSHHLSDSARQNLLARIKQLEHEGYDFEAAEGTFELLVRQAAAPDFHPFKVLSYEVTTRLAEGTTSTSAFVELEAGSAVHSHRATGSGPVHALDVCLRQCLAPVFPAITAVRLVDYKVRVLGIKGGTESKVRVHVEWTDGENNWSTVGVSDNVIDASWHALSDALRLELIRLEANTPVLAVSQQEIR